MREIDVTVFSFARDIHSGTRIVSVADEEVGLELGYSEFRTRPEIRKEGEFYSWARDPPGRDEQRNGEWRSQPNA